MITSIVIAGGVIILAIMIFSRKDKLKDSLQKRIEKNAIKIPEATWIDKKGEVHTEDVIIKRSNIPLIGDWSRIYPPIDEEENINWMNALFGGKKNLIKLIVILVIVGLIMLGFREIFSNYEALRTICEPYLSLR